MGWALDRDGTNEKEVAWLREEDGVVVSFVREGFGDPWSDEKTPPDAIDKYAGPIIEVEAPAIPGAKEREEAINAIARIRAELDVLTALL